MPNHLTNEISPYLLQHANNPVDWYPWNNQALSRAREEQKPIFLSIGYAACHWCHVMERETFEDVQVADFLNQYFISIKVDREERPDLDSIYMSAVVEMTQQGGWPMSVFLTPNLQPFYGGTYFPPTPRHGLPAFLEVLQAVQAAWSQERDKVVHVSDHILDAIRAKSVLHDRHLDTLQPKILSEAITGLLSTYDWTYGGWGRAPKFPQPMLLEILLLHAADGSQEAGQAVAHALDAMSRGGMYDVIGGGFHRYSTDTGWLVPHFEKMLYDNAQLALVYLHAYKQTNEIRFRNVAEDTLDFMLSEMRHPQGGFYTSIDADSIDGEGLFYTWKLAELKGIITNPQDWFLFSSTYDLSENGNFEGRIILQRRRSFTQTAKVLNLSLSDYTSSLGRIHKSLEGSRQSRIRPQTDDKVITAWNGLAINAFIQAGRYLDRKDYLQAAQDCARFILTHLRINGVLYRSWRQGKTSVPGFLEDYGSLILSLISLYQSDGDQSWFNLAQSLTDEALTLFADPEGGFFDTQADSEGLIFRPKDVQDNATPSGSAMMTRVLLELSSLTDHDIYFKSAEIALAAIQEAAGVYPGAFGSWLAAFDLAVNSIRQVAVVWDSGDPGIANSALLDFLLSTYFPRTILARSPFPIDSHAPTILHNRSVINNLPTAYVCHNFVCQLPTTNPDVLRDQLE